MSILIIKLKLNALNYIKVEETVMPYLTAMADFRDDVRKAARELKAVEILQKCDRLRDDTLPNLGVRLEDKVRFKGCVQSGLESPHSLCIKWGMND